MSEINDRLIVSLEANVQKLDEGLTKAIAKMNATDRAVYGAAGRIKKTIDGANDNWSHLFTKSDPGKAVEKIFDSSRLKILDTGTARIGLMGSALEYLGPAGLAAAAGIAAAVGAFEGVKKTAEWADDLEVTSKRLQMGVEDIQAWRHAFLLNDIAVGEGETSLQNFNAALGRLQDGAARGALKKYGALLFSPEERKSLHDASDALPLMANRMEKFGTSTKQAIEQAFKIQALAPIMNQGGDAIAGLLGQARSLGIVVDESLVRQAAAANEKFKILKEVVGAELMTAFADLAPIIGEVAEKLAEAAHNAAEFFGITGNQRLIAQAANLRQETGHAREVQQAQASGAFDVGDGPFGAAAGYFNRFVDLGPKGVLHPNDAIGKMYDKLEADRAGLLKNIPSATPPPKPRPDVHPDLSTPKKKPTDQSAQVEDAAEKAKQAAVAGLLADQVTAITDQLALDKQQLAPLASIVADIDKRAELEQQRLATELKAKEAEIDGQEATLKTKFKKHEITKAAYNQAYADTEAARKATEAAALQGQINVAKTAVRDKVQAQLDAENRIFDELQYIAAANSHINSIGQDLATTLDERRSLALQQLDADYALKLKGIDSDLANGKITADQAAERRTKEGQVYTSDKAKTQADLAGPVDQYMRSIKDLNTEIQDDGVQAFKSLSDSLGQSAANALGLKGALGQFFASVISQIFQYETAGSAGGLIKGVAGLFTGFHATGGYIPPGKWGIAGDAGPEPVFGGKTGLTVLPNGVLNGIQNVRAPQANGGYAPSPVTVHLQVDPSPYFDAHVVTLAGPVAGQVANAVFSSRASQAARTRRLGS